MNQTKGTAVAVAATVLVMLVVFWIWSRGRTVDKDDAELRAKVDSLNTVITTAQKERDSLHTEIAALQAKADSQSLEIGKAVRDGIIARNELNRVKGQINYVSRDSLFRDLIDIARDVPAPTSTARKASGN